MAYDHEEQEQLEALKTWWKQYGNLVTWTLIVVLAAFSAWKGWGIYQSKQAVQASILFEQVQQSLQDKDGTKVTRAVADLEDKYPGTYYAQMAGLLAAKFAYDSNDVKTAKSQLGWVQEHGKSLAFKAMAKLRLAAILLDEKAYDAALAQLNGEFPPEYVGAVADGKGDILVAQNKLDEARAAYALALEKNTGNSPAAGLIQLKLDALGGPKPVLANK